MSRDRDERENDIARPSNRQMDANSSPPVNEPPIDPERIAALIDGRLSDTERAALLAKLDASPEALEVYADAVAALGDDTGGASHATGGGSPVVPRSRRPFRNYAPVIALAAVLLFAVALPFMRRTSGAALETPQTIAALLQPTEETATAWQRTPWSELRGTSDALSPRARGVRIGARIVDLAMLTRARDTAATRVALQIASLLEGIPAGGVAASSYRALADQGAATATESDLRRAASFAEQVAGVDDVRTGAWLEAARMAAVARNESFFASSSVRDAERTISSLTGLSSPARSALAEVTRLLAASARDWPAIERALSTLLREVATG
jgi:hypothetical protein